MNDTDFKRKLTTIFSADVVGYSRLMGEDELETVKTLTTYREIMASLIKQHRGRVVDSPGDNLLAEFSSVVDGVQCAVAVQKEFQARNADLPENRRMEFRIGVNLGDVIEEEDRIYGDGVNVAARLEGLADPGGICISKTAFDHIESKLPLGYEFLGEQEVKNIAKPVGAYRVLMEPRITVAGKKAGVAAWRGKALYGVIVLALVAIVGVLVWKLYWHPAPPIEKVQAPWKPAHELPDKPSIAVLPFANMSGDPKDEYLGDGLTEQIITTLSMMPRLFVVARNSTFTYKGKPVMVQQVAQDLGVRYVLEGSILKSQERVRITAQLIDAKTGQHLWAESYDRKLEDIFDLQDDITLNILKAMNVQLAEGKQAKYFAKGTKNVKAYLKTLESIEHFRRFNPEDIVICRKLAEEVIAMDPEYPEGYAMVAWTYLLEVNLGWTKSPKESLEIGTEMTQKVLELEAGKEMAHGHYLMSYVHLIRHEFDQAITEIEKAVAVYPNGADVTAFYGMVLRYGGRPAEAIEWYKKAIRLNPIPPNWYLHNLGNAYRDMGRYDEAIKEFEKALNNNPNHFPALIGLASSLSMSGKIEEAKAAAEKVLSVNPKFNLENFERATVMKDQAAKKRVMEALRKAGLPDCPPRQSTH